MDSTETELIKIIK